MRKKSVVDTLENLSPSFSPPPPLPPPPPPPPPPGTWGDVTLLL